MKIFKWIGSVVLLAGLAVSTAGAATSCVGVTCVIQGTAPTAYDLSGGNTYEATEEPFYSAGINTSVNPGVSVGNDFTHYYYFHVTDLLGLSAYLAANVTVGTTAIANLTFQWVDSAFNDVGSDLVVTDANGDSLFTYPNKPTFTQSLLNAYYYLKVTGDVVGPVGATLDTSYDFSITSAVPLPAAFWLFGSALVAFVGFGRRSIA